MRAIATEFVEKTNSKTFCSNCGGQPIEWHHDDHPNRPNARVSSLRAQGASITRIQQEMDRCTPLCRKCHMQGDGRMKALKDLQPYQKGKEYVSKSPCALCGRSFKPLRKGLCWSCSEDHRSKSKRYKGHEYSIGCCD